MVGREAVARVAGAAKAWANSWGAATAAMHTPDTRSILYTCDILRATSKYAVHTTAHIPVAAAMRAVVRAELAAGVVLEALLAAEEVVARERRRAS